MLKKLSVFAKEVIKRIINNHLFTQSNAMTFRLILAIFPLIIVMISSLGFFNIDISIQMERFIMTLPNDIRDVANQLIKEVFETKQVSILSTSAFVSLFSASSGFMSMIDGMNTAFDKERNQDYIRTRIACVILVIIFICLIAVSLGLLIFGDIISNILIGLHLGEYIPKAFSSIAILCVGVFIGVVFFIILHKIAVDKNIPLKVILPGAFFTVGTWLVASKIFNFYINNFARYSIIYGSIGAFFVFALWLNILSFVILTGAQINAVLYDEKFMEKLKGVS